MAQHGGVAVGDPHEHAAIPRLQVFDAHRVGLAHFELHARNRIAVGVCGRVAELRRDQSFEFFTEHVLEHLGLLVHAIPRHAQLLGEVPLEQPVVPDHFQCHAPSSLGEPYPVIGLVGYEVLLGKPLDHRCGRGRCDGKPLGERRCRYRRPVPALFERVDRLGVVLHRVRNIWRHKSKFSHI